MNNESFDLANTKRLEDQYIMTTYARQPVLFVRGHGSTLVASDGKSYLDFISGIGVNVLGYDHPRIRRVMSEQASLMHTSNLYYHPYQGLLAEQLANASGLSRAFFCNSGTETAEAALKLARAWQRRQGREDKFEFVSLTGSFHGRSMGSLSVTAQDKYRAPFEPLVPGCKFIPAGDHDAARAAINERTAAVIVETIQGEGGVRPQSPEYLQTLRDACTATDALFIVDEVQCGLGRTGKIFAYQHSEVQADILTVAKPLGLGVPLGAIVVSEKAADGFQPGDHGTTFGGGPLACRLSLEFFEELNENGLLQTVNETGNYFKQKLLRLQELYPDTIKEVRAMGLMIGVELNFPTRNFPTKMLERGFLMNSTNDTTCRFLPPYIIKASEIDSMLTAWEEVLVEEAREVA